MAGRGHSDQRTLDTSAVTPDPTPPRARRARPRTIFRRPRSWRQLALLATIALLLPLVPLSLFAANNFTDLNPGSVHNDDIDTAYNLGLASGLSDTTFDPNSAVTREQMASFLVRAAKLDRIAYTSFPSAGADADVGPGPSRDYMTVTLTAPGRDEGPLYVRVSFTGYVFAKSATAYTQNPNCTPACMVSGKLRLNGDTPRVVTRSVVGANANDYVGQAGPPVVAVADRKDFSGSTVFAVAPGTHTFTMSVTREIGTAENVGFAFGSMQAELIPFGGSGMIGAQFAATLNGPNEVPSAGDANGSGSASVSINTTSGELCYSLSVSNIAAATAAHLHRGATGVAGPVVVNFAAPASGTANGCLTIDTALAREIADNPSGFYVNVHNGEFPAGAVRGQLGE